MSESLSLLDYLAPRERRQRVQQQVRTARAGLHALRKEVLPYQGGLPLELFSACLRKRATRQAARLAVRQAVLSRTGRRIDLAPLLRQRRADGLPVWALVDPMQAICRTNGQRDTDGTFGVAGRWIKITNAELRVNGVVKAHQPVGGIPALPEQARRLFRSKALRRRANWMALLYQPAQWEEVRPDPAVIVEWKDLPGQYYALCVWGHDRGRVMEFVH